MSNSTIAIADSGFVIAVAVSSDVHHQRCVPVFKQYAKILIPQTTFAEIGYLLTKAVGNQGVAKFLRAFPHPRYEIVPLIESDWQRAADILDKYADSRVDFVDATVIAVAERTQTPRILTVDRRDFAMVKPVGLPFFEILP